MKTLPPSCPPRGRVATRSILLLAGLWAILPPPPVQARQATLETVPPESVGLRASGLEEVTALLRRAVEEGQIVGGVAGVARGGEVPYLEAVGLQDTDSGRAMTERSLFRIYSMSKAITAVAAFILHEEGHFELDDPVSLHLPQFSQVQVLDAGDGSLRPPTGPVTVRDLFLHTSGLSHRTSDLYRDREVRRRDQSMERFLDHLVRAPLLEDPGLRYRYSESPTVLGALIEVWSGQPLDEFLETRLFGPLGMVDTGFQVRPDQLDRFTTVYGPGDDGLLRPVQLEEVPFTERPDLFEGAIGLLSTVPDYLRFAGMLRNRGELDGVRILRPETVDRIVANGLSAEVLGERPGTMGWGLANVNVTLDPASLAFPAGEGEYGWQGSAGTVFWIDPQTDLTVVLMWQSSPANPASLAQQIRTLIHEAVVE